VTAVDAYPDRARNEIYNLLFADDVDALKPALPEADLAEVAADDEANRGAGGCLPTVEGRRKTAGR
jgi:hypothetical protein